MQGDTWEVSVPARRQRLICKSFPEAARRANELAILEPECELVVRDAYHRVIQRRHLAQPRQLPARD